MFINLLVDLLNFEERGTVFFYVMTGIILFVVTFLIVAIPLIKVREKRYLDSLSKKFFTSRTYIVNFKTKNVSFFNFRSLNKVKDISYDEFINLLHNRDHLKFKKWLESLLDDETKLTKEESVFVSTILLKKNKKRKLTKNNSVSYRIIFTVTCIDRKAKLLYLETYLLYNLPTENSKLIKGNQRKEVYSMKEISVSYAHGYFQKSNMVTIRLFHKPSTVSRINEYELRYIILNSLYRSKFATNAYFSFSDNNPLEITFFDMKSTNYYFLGKFIKSLEPVINACLEVHGYKDFYTYTMSAGKVNELKGNYDKAFETLDNLCQLSLETDKPYMIYKNDDKETLNIEESYKLEVNKVIRNNLVESYFQPVIKIANVRLMTLGYYVTFKLKGSIFQSMNELKMFAKKYDLDKELFSLVAKKVISTFNSEKESLNHKLFYPVSIHEVPYVIRSFSHMSGSESMKVVIIIENNDLVDCETNIDLLQNIKNIQSYGYQVFLKMNVGDYVLKNSTYELFDGYLVNSKMSSQTKAESREYYQAYAVFDKLYTYKKPIISVETTSFQEIELLVKTGVYVFSSDIIGAKSPMLIPVDRKKTKRLVNMYKKEE